jgi:simple sugar transport system substrate-binding protein
MMKNYTIATVGKIAPHPWFDRMDEGVKKFGKDTGHTTFLRCPPRIDETLEEEILKEIIDQRVDALCVVSFFPQALEMILSKAQKQGIIVVTHEAPNQRNTDYDIEAFNNYEYGAHLMDHLATYMGTIGEYALFLESLVTKSHSEWAEGARTRQRKKYPSMRLVTKKIEHHEDQNIAYIETKKLLKSYPNLKGILGLGVASIPGASRAVGEEGLCEQVKIVGNCLVSMSEECLRKGAVQLISFWDPADIGYIMNKLAVMVLSNESITNDMDLGVPGYNHIRKEGKVLYGSAWIDVTKENMSKYPF